MEDNIIGMDRERVIKFIKENTINKEFNELQIALVSTILNIIPVLGHYEEEDRKLNFKIAVGMEATRKKLTGRFHSLRDYEYNNTDSQEKIIQIIEKMIKEVAIFCQENADIFIIQNGDKIECGIYFTDLEKTGLTENSILSEKFIMIQNLYKNKTLILADNNKKLYLCMDLECNEDIVNTYSSYNMTKDSDIYRKWKGIFERVRKTVHGTICLIVNDKWKVDDDDNFTSEIKELDIKLENSNSTSIDGLRDFNNKISMFFNMLNYDGITIINNMEIIKAYNVFCKVGTDKSTVIDGGARHRAYNYLIKLADPKNYVAVYFQSQEGEIKFYIYNDYKELNYFDPEVMITEEPEGLEGPEEPEGPEEAEESEGPEEPEESEGSEGLEGPEKPEESEGLEGSESLESIELLIQKYYKGENDSTKELLKLEKEEQEKYQCIKESVEELLDAHEGMNNFYSEPRHAKHLMEILEEYKVEEINTFLLKYSGLRKNLINTVTQCIIGNTYGYSRDAQSYLDEIINLISKENWNKYFEEKQYLDKSLLWDLSIEHLHVRWKEILNKLVESHEDLKDLIERNIYSAKEFDIIYDKCPKVSEDN